MRVRLLMAIFALLWAVDPSASQSSTPQVDVNPKHPSRRTDYDDITSINAKRATLARNMSEPITNGITYSGFITKPQNYIAGMFEQIRNNWQLDVPAIEWRIASGGYNRYTAADKNGHRGDMAEELCLEFDRAVAKGHMAIEIVSGHKVEKPMPVTRSSGFMMGLWCTADLAIGAVKEGAAAKLDGFARPLAEKHPSQKVKAISEACVRNDQGADAPTSAVCHEIGSAMAMLFVAEHVQPDGSLKFIDDKGVPIIVRPGR